ncbi:hypothetical protein BCR33DRAFT_723368 [Rhizoclosmatium globosum]|uniref:Uncharacterized protein n=1 Tax=Rhizoclosmatium globosum TaxID=329046 RepID=A0A1Y2BD06_9FUNG|nr:hypothetical protein BCR33DRAFT_723368 [Rhizoclosmatium globosum]|eukprot:ORY32703.1 hypothetical protein BCR33DRAFT_723368 [Rhizoclosmatium globosum]
MDEKEAETCAQKEITAKESEKVTIDAEALESAPIVPKIHTVDSPESNSGGFSPPPQVRPSVAFRSSRPRPSSEIGVSGSSNIRSSAVSGMMGTRMSILSNRTSSTVDKWESSKETPIISGEGNATNITATPQDKIPEQPQLESNQITSETSDNPKRSASTRIIFKKSAVIGDGGIFGRTTSLKNPSPRDTAAIQAAGNSIGSGRLKNPDGPMKNSVQELTKKSISFSMIPIKLDSEEDVTPSPDVVAVDSVSRELGKKKGLERRRSKNPEKTKEAVVESSSSEEEVEGKQSSRFDSSRRQSFMSQSNKSALNSMHSSIDEDGTMAKMMRLQKAVITTILESEVYKWYRRTVDSVRNQILFVAFLQVLVSGSILIMIKVIMQSQLPSIRFYNLTHAVLAFQGKLLLLLGWELVRLVAKGFAASEMSHTHRGVSIVDVAHLNPSQGKQLGKMFMSSLLLVELMLWVLSFLMHWEPVETYLGTFPCITNTYYGNWSFTDNFDVYIAANMEFGVLEAFGLPITAGIVGGLAATPLAAPNSNFQMEQHGIIYAVNTICTNATVLQNQPSTGVTNIQLSNQEFWGQVYNVAMTIRYPAGAHAWTQYAQYDLQQKCQVSVVTGTGYVTFSYTSDEWGSITNGKIQQLIVGEGDSSSQITVTPNMQGLTDFGSITTALGSSTQMYENITQWIGEGIQLGFGVPVLHSLVTQGSGAYFLVWAQRLDGRYDPALTWKGISSGVAAISHYVLNQGDANQNSNCAYNGMDGVGILEAPEWISTVLLGLVITGICFGMGVVGSWILIAGGGEAIDRAAQILDHPLRMLYYLRDSAHKLVTKIRGDDIGQISLEQHLANTMVRFGEDKTTRGGEIGTLVLDTPKAVVKMARNRKLA